MNDKTSYFFKKYMMIIAIIMLILTPAFSITTYNVYGEEINEDDGETIEEEGKEVTDKIEEDAEEDKKESEGKEESTKEDKAISDEDEKEESTKNEKSTNSKSAKVVKSEAEPEKTKVAPETPYVRQATCDVAEPEIDLSETEGVSYEIEGDVNPGETVTITATPIDDSYELDLAQDWQVQEGLATYDIELAEVDCEEESETELGDGEILNIDRDGCIVSITTALDEGDYTLEVWDDSELAVEIAHTMSEPGEYIFTWEIENPAKEGAPGVGFKLRDANHEVVDSIDPYEYPAEVAAECSEPNPDPETQDEVTPEVPEVTQATCDVPEPKIEFPEKDGILYEFVGEVKAGETVTIIAGPMDGESEFIVPDDWTLQEEGIATIDIELENVDCDEEKDKVDVKIVTVDRDGCIVSITTELGEGDYTLEVWDDQVLIDEISHTMSEAGEYVFTWEIEQAAMEGAPGVAFVIKDEGGKVMDVLDPYEYPREVAQTCSGVKDEDDEDDKEAKLTISSDQVTPVKDEPEIKATVEESKESTAGETLPKTATSMFNSLLIGSLLLAFGGITLFIYRRREI